jgi:uncharacterized protein with GYD domain
LVLVGQPRYATSGEEFASGGHGVLLIAIDRAKRRLRAPPFWLKRRRVHAKKLMFYIASPQEEELYGIGAPVGAADRTWDQRRPAGRIAMPTYVTLSNFTDQGLRNIKDTVKRSEAFRKAAKESGVTIRQYDLITIMEVADEGAANALALNIAKMGNVRGQTLRAFTAAEMEKTLEKVS